jgi:hypothetical protein
MIPADHDWRAESPVPHHLVEEESGAITLSVAEPTDTGRKPLKGDLFASEAEPFMQPFVIRKELQDSLICFSDVGGIA